MKECKFCKNWKRHQGNTKYGQIAWGDCSELIREVNGVFEAYAEITRNGEYDTLPANNIETHEVFGCTLFKEKEAP